MATSELIQYLGTGSGVSTSHRRTEETFLASAAITAGDAVSFDLSKTADGDKTLYVIKADTDTATAKCFVGIALETQATVGGKIKVCIAGICDANVAAAVAGAGEALVIGATGGRLDVYAAASLLPIAAISCEDDSAVANVATVFVLRQF
jgi:hypothetical protein